MTCKPSCVFSLVLLAAVLPGCSSSAKSSNTAADQTAVKAKVAQFIDTDDCSTLTRQLIESNYEGEADPMQACKSDPFHGMGKGDYKIKSASVSGDKATVVAIPKQGGSSRYQMVREDNRWYISSMSLTPSPTEAKLGGPLFTSGAGYINDEPTEMRLTVTVQQAKAAPGPSQYDEPYLAGAGYWKLKAKIRSESNTTINFNVEDFALVSSSGSRFKAAGYPFVPSLGNCCSDIAPGDTLSGFASFEVPKGTRITGVQYSPSMLQAPPLRWSLK